MRARSVADAKAGEILLSVENISLGFGGVKALTDISFDIRKSRIRAIASPQRRRPTSMLNVVDSSSIPQQGRVRFPPARLDAGCAP